DRDASYVRVGRIESPARWRCASMRKFSFRTAVLALVGTLFVGVAAYAADPPATTDQHRQAYESRLQQKLGLTADQVQKPRDSPRGHGHRHPKPATQQNPS